MNLSWSTIPAAIKTGGIAALLGFFVSCSSTSTRSGPGGFECDYTDGAALLFGVVAIVGGLIGIAQCVRRKEDDRILLFVASLVIVGVGVVHILRGIGSVGGPCN